MNIEERVTDALDDFEGLIAQGVDVENAVRHAAAAQGLKPEVLLARAERKFGDLTTLSARLRHSATDAQRAASIKSAIYRYCQDYFGAGERVGPYVEIEDWLEAALKIELTAKERVAAREEMQQAFHRSMIRDLDQMLREERFQQNASN